MKKSDQKEVHERQHTMTEENAEASVPEDESVCGEEDPGAALEDFVTQRENEKSKSQ